MKLIDILGMVGGKRGAQAAQAVRYWKAARAARYYIRKEGLSEPEAIFKAADKYDVDLLGVRAKMDKA